MRVLLDTRLESGEGVGRYGRTLIGGLRTAAPEVHAEALRASGRLARLTRAPFTPWGRVSVRRVVRHRSPDVIHGTHLELPPAAGVASVVTIFDVIPLDHPASMPSRARRTVYRRILEASLRRADRIIVPSEATARALGRRGVEAAKLRVVPLAVDPIFGPLAETERSEARRRFAGGRPYVAASVTGRAHKNAARLAAAAALLDSSTGVPVVSTGPALPAPGSLRFTGRLSDGALRSLYAGAEAVVVPSLVEGFGLPAAEALACGVPVVCGNGLGALAYIRPGAVVVQVEDPERLADGMRRLVEDERLRLELGEAGRTAVAALSVESMAASTVGVYRDAMASFSRAHSRATGARGGPNY